MLRKECCPFVVDERGVGLEGVENDLPGSREAPLEASRVSAKKSMPIRVGSPPWKATTTSSTPRWAARNWPMYASCTSAGMRKPPPGHSSSLERKKKYSQSRLQIAPVGLAMTWNGLRDGRRRAPLSRRGAIERGGRGRHADRRLASIVPGGMLARIDSRMSTAWADVIGR